MKTGRIRIIDPEYPALLREIADPPQVLYYRGDLSLLECRGIAVVGSRKSTPYGLRVARALGHRAAKSNAVLISGLARGIDSAAQEACLELGGKVISVMAGGLDLCYPKENRQLMQDIADKGLLLSEYPDGTLPRRYMFPKRNRIISGLSAGVVVVEAGFHSGALKTAEYAVEQGRELFAVPGNIGSAESLGTNKLIQDGASVVTVIGDPFSALGFHTEDMTQATERFSNTENQILNLLRNRGELLPEDIVEDTHLSPETVLQIVTILEMKGVVHTGFGRVFLDSDVG